MNRTTRLRALAASGTAALGLALALAPVSVSAAEAEPSAPFALRTAWAQSAAGSPLADANAADPVADALSSQSALVRIADELSSAGVALADERACRTEFVLAYDPALIGQIGSQSSTGHWICCPSFACAYGDAVIHGTANPHEQYGCGCCTWPGWGGGNSSFRSLGSDTALLREAYDSIAAGKPTVVHVTGPTAEHWICLIGYTGVEDPDNLSLGNFIALDPTDGAQINAGSRYQLYGDACEHVSEA